MIMSFGYDQNPLPRADKVFDVRDLTHAVNSTQFLAREDEIADYCRQHPSEAVAIGCANGTHRSKILADRIAKRLRTSVFHREG
jgi:RNase adaptor protein for sRNA GlmZ degradation